jgi:3-oxoacyl-[acyl-carrier-protein] synthase-3
MITMGVIFRCNPIIRNIAYYHPERKVDNDFYIDHFKKIGKDVTGLLSSTGRSSRYISDDPQETMLTMGYLAAVKVLELSYVKASYLDLIVFASGTPEYILPANSLKLHDMLQAGQNTAVYDLNACCAGMLVAIDQVCRYMRSNTNTKYALVVGSDQMNKYSNDREAISYCNFGDSGCAVLLENVANTDRGFIDSNYYTNSSNHDKINFPANGMTSALRDQNSNLEDRLIKWINFDLSGAFFSAQISINEILFRNNLTKESVRKYCVSQFAKSNLDAICNDLDEDIDKFVFVGDEFGYTGVTSPLLAYAKTTETNPLKMGDYVVFWTVGAGTTCVCLLYKC